MMKNILFLIPLLLVMSCLKEEKLMVDGKKPVYLSSDNVETIGSKEVRNFRTVNKIFILGDQIYITDKGSGVHIIDNTNPSSPQKVSFISIFGNNDVVVKDNVLYADNASNLLAIDITDIHNATLFKKIENVFENNSEEFPNDYEGYFECVDQSKGFVVDWVDTELKNPKCQR